METKTPQRSLQARGMLSSPRTHSSFTRVAYVLCRWFTRYSGWGPGQLQRECASGVWFTAAASSAFVLQQGAEDRGASGREMWHQVLPGLPSPRAAWRPVQMLHRTHPWALTHQLISFCNIHLCWTVNVGADQRGACSRLEGAKRGAQNNVIAVLSDPAETMGQPSVHPFTGLAARHSTSEKEHWCWLQILELMGGEHAAISEAAKGMHNIEVTGPLRPAEAEDSPPEKQESPSEQKESE